MSSTKVQTNRTRSWGKLIFALFLVWSFGWVVGPYINNNIPTYKEIIQVVEDRDIDSAAYMYEESVGSYDGEYYLSDSFKHSGRKDYGPTKAFFSGMAICFVLLAFGWRYMMDP
jgi:hypothetical protein